MNPSVKPGIQYILLHNFKSFSGTHRIGPFLDFTAVIGPNGGGKSNIMDAISFCLGVKSIDLRATNLKELIYRKEDEVPGETGRSSFVEIKLVNAFSREIHLKRTINPGGSSEYYINHEKFSYEEYNKCLEESNILVKAKNFLVFQGQVDALAMKSGKELTALFEKIAGSDEFESEYEEAKENVNRKHQQMKAISNRIDFLKAEKKKLKAQKANAMEYDSITNKLKNLQIDYHTAQLVMHEREIESKVNAREETMNELEQAKKDKEKAAVKLRDCENQLKKYEDKILSSNDALQGKAQQLLIKRPQLARLKETIKGLEQTIEHKEASIADLNTEIQENSVKKQEISRELEYLENSIHDKIAANSQSAAIELEPKLKEEYFLLKKEAGLRTFSEKKELEMAKKDLAAKQLALAQAQEMLVEKQNLKQNLDKQIDGLTKEIAVLQIDQSTNEAKLNARAEEFKVGSEEMEYKRGIYKDLADKLVIIEDALRQSTVYLHVNKEREKEKSAIDEILRSIPGIRGRFRDLVTPISQKYSLSLSAGLGNILEYIIADTIESAGSLNMRLKEKSLQKDILILENLPDIRINEALRHSLSGSGLLLPDVLNYDKSYGLEKAVMVFCGNKVVTESLDSANLLRTMRGVKMVITLEGVIIKNGMITSATRKRKEQKTSNIEKLEREQESLKEEIEVLEGSLKSFDSLQTLKQDISDCTYNLRKITGQLEFTEESLNSLIDARKQVNVDIKELEKKVRQIQNSLKPFQDKCRNIEASIQNIYAGVFVGLCKRLGLRSYTELENTSLADSEKLQDELQKLRIEQAKAQTMADSIDLEGSISNLQMLTASLDKDRAQLASLISKTSALEDEISSLKQAQDQDKSSESAIRKEIAGSNENRLALRGKFEQSTKKCMSLEKAIVAEERELESLIEQKRQAIEELLVKDLSMPFTKNSDSVDLDFNKIDCKIIRMTDKQLDEECDRLAIHIEKETKNIEDIASKGKCTFNPDKMQEIEFQIKDLISDTHTANEALNEAQGKFNELKEKRKSRFLETFMPVAGIINRIYKEMTKLQKNNYYGGNALLYLEDADEPYNGGVIYSPTPPGKRCMYEMEQLSGGEKTIAALSLLFAIRAAHPSPFYILDEVDAFLDIENRQLLLGYLQSICSEVQCIMITHKEEFYVNADNLIGTTFIPSELTSRAYSLDLRSIGVNQLAVS
jgi:structural maintenance of chromosome 1